MMAPSSRGFASAGEGVSARRGLREGDGRRRRW
ncbi:unnamed protein product, partial [Linum tenue]